MRWTFSTAIDYYASSDAQSLHQPQVVQSCYAGSVTVPPVFTRQHSTPDLRFLLYARKVQSQYPRIWSMTYTPIARAIQSRVEPFQLASRNKLIQILMPSPSFRGMSKVRTLQTEISCVTIVRFRLGISLCDGVSEIIPVFPGLQTGSSSLSTACQVSLDVLGKTPSLPAFILSVIRALLSYTSRRAQATLWSSSPGLIDSSIFHISCFQHPESSLIYHMIFQ